MSKPLQKPLFVIVPIYNAENFLQECLDSLSYQSYKNSTFLLINDGSSDNSEQIAKEYVAKDSRFILINQQNSGVSSARNAGLEYVKNALESNKLEYGTHLDSGDTDSNTLGSGAKESGAPLNNKTSKNMISAGGGAYIGFVDSDDVISQNYYRNLIAILESKGVQIAKSRDIRIFDDTNYNKEDFKILQAQTKGFVHTFTSKTIGQKAEIWRGVYDYELIKSLRFENLKRGQDVVFSTCVQILAKKIAYTRNARYFYRQHSGSAMKNYCGDRWLCYNFFEAIFRFCQNQGGFEYGLVGDKSLRNQAKDFINDKASFAELKDKVKALQIPQNLLDKSKIAKTLLESSNAKEFLARTIGFKEWFKDRFQIRFSRKQNIIKLFGKILYAGKRI